MNKTEGHRARLREKFQTDPQALSSEEQLELLLTRVILRRDVAPLARELITRFGSLQGVFDASIEQLTEVKGVGEITAAYIQLLGNKENDFSKNDLITPDIPGYSSSSQLNLFDLDDEEQNDSGKEAEHTPNKQRAFRVFVDDEIVNSKKYLPQIASFSSLDGFKQYLNEKLPYNAAETRQRRTHYIIDRFFPEGNFDTPLTYFLAQKITEKDLSAVLFYHLLKAEMIAAKVADELIWPALPYGKVDREKIRDFICQYLPKAGQSSQKKMLRALLNTYNLLGIGSLHDQTLRFQLHQGTLESFIYLLTAEYPQPGIYSFESLYKGPIHRWLLWDREWIRLQLYNLQDYGILTKVSEIDTVRQFTLGVNQRTALQQFFEHPQRGRLAAREQKADSGYIKDDG